MQMHYAHFGGHLSERHKRAIGKARKAYWKYLPAEDREEICKRMSMFWRKYWNDRRNARAEKISRR